MITFNNRVDARAQPLKCRSAGDDLVNPRAPRPQPAAGIVPGLLAITVDVQRSRRQAAMKTPDGILTLHRIIKPVRAHSTSPCCGHTTISVRQVASTDPHAPRTCAIMGVRTCGRPVHVAGHKCGSHQRAKQFEVWAVRRAHAQQSAGAAQAQQGLPGPQDTQAALLFACNTLPQLAAFLSVDPEQLGFVDHWGQYGVSYDDVVAAPGLRVEEAPPGQQHGLPAWRRAQLHKRVKRSNTRGLGLQVHVSQEPHQVQELPPPPVSG